MCDILAHVDGIKVTWVAELQVKKGSMIDDGCLTMR